MCRMEDLQLCMRWRRWMAAVCMNGKSLKALTRIINQSWKRSPLLTTATTTKNMTKLPLAVINDVKWIEIFFFIRLLFLQPVTSADLHVHECRFPFVSIYSMCARVCMCTRNRKYDCEKSIQLLPLRMLIFFISYYYYYFFFFRCHSTNWLDTCTIKSHHDNELIRFWAT